MAEILFLDRLRQAKNTPQTTFRQLVSERLGADLSRKREILRSFGNPTATIHDGDVKQPSDHIMLMFSGTGPLEGYSFGFAIRADSAASIQAEIHVFDSASTSLLSKKICSCSILDYTSEWLQSAYNTALEVISPVSQPSRSSNTARA